MTIMNNKNERFEELDALRGIAALVVIFFHFTLWRPEAEFGFKYGTTGVDLFFIISGFVIFNSLNNVKSISDFIINRISRLYPTYWTCVTFSFVLIIINSIYQHRSISFVQYIGNMTMFQYYIGIKDIDGPYWTMIVEMVFYISILPFFYFKKLQYFKKTGLLVSVSLVISIFLFDEKILKSLFFYFPLFQFLPLFLAGLVFYKLKTEIELLKVNYVYLIICLVCQILLFQFSGRSNGFINQKEYSIILALFFMIFILFVNNKMKIVINKGTLFFGKISFAMYLIHQKISLGFIIPFLMDKCEFSFWFSTLFFAFPIVVALATFITYYIEIPLSKRLKVYLKRMIYKHKNLFIEG